MIILAFALIFGGLFVFMFSFIIRFGKNDLDKNLREAVSDFERKKESDDNFTDKDNNIIDHYKNDSDNIAVFEESDDRDFEILIGETKSFLRLVGAAVIVIGIVVYFVYS